MTTLPWTLTTRISSFIVLTCSLAYCQTSAKISVGYYPNWVNVSDSTKNPTTLKTLYQSGALTNLTYLNYAFASVDASGNCSVNAGDVENSVVRQYTAAESVDGIADSTDPKQLHGDLNQLLKLKNLLRLQGKALKILISVGGSNYGAGTVDGVQSTFSKAAGSANVANFATTCINTFIAGNFSNAQNGSANTLSRAYPGIFDGIDIDWEYPDYANSSTGVKDDFANLMSVFRTQLNTYATGHQLPTLALTAAISQDLNEAHYYGLSVPGYPAPAYSLTTTNLTLFNVMAYDYENTTNPVQSNAPLPGIEYDVYNLVQANVPTSKMVLGVPFYGVSWTCKPATCPAPTSSSLQPTLNLSSSWTASTMNLNVAGNPASGALTTPYWAIQNTVTQDGSKGIIGHDTSNLTPNGQNPSSTWGTYFYDPTTSTLWNYDDGKTSNDVDSIYAKAQYVLTGTAVPQMSWDSVSPLAGMMAWDLSQDSSTGTLLCSVEDDLAGVACTAPPAASEITLSSSISGASFTIANLASGGTDCPLGTFNAPVSVMWSKTHGCLVTANAPAGYVFSGWVDGNETNPRSFAAQTASASYTADFTEPQTCTFTLSASSETVAGSATAGTVNVTANTGCAWTAASNATWITISSGASGNGSGTVHFAIAANTTSAIRTGTLTVAGHTFTVTQSVSSTGGTRIFAPYVDMSLTSDEQIATMQQQAGLKAVTMAFLVGTGTGCGVGWNGLNETLPADTMPDGVSIQSAIQSLHANGVQVIPSFGGPGQDPAETCTNVADIQALYQSVITRYNVTTLDFVIEGSALTNQASITRRDQALAALKAANPSLTISYTLPALQSGLSASGVNVINKAKADGVTLKVVNILVMDFGSAVSNMAQAATSAAAATESQLAAANLTGTTVGVTPMIGVNDTPGETFTLANAQTVLNFAEGNAYVDRLSMWSLARDNGNCAGTTSASAVCSGISQATYAFSALFNEVQ